MTSIVERGPSADARRTALASHVSVLVLRVVGIGLSFGGTVVTAGLITRRFGIQEYGYVMLLAAIPSMLPFASLGVSAPVINQTALWRPGEETGQLASVVTSATALLIKVSAAIIVVSAVVAVTPTWAVVLGLPVSDSATVNAVVSMIAFAMCLSLFGGIGTGVLVGLDRVGETIAYQALQPLLVVVGSLLLLTTNVSPLWLGLMLPASQAVVALLLLHAAHRRLHTVWSAVRAGLRPFGERASVVSEALPMTVMQVSRALGLQSDRLVLSHRSNALELGQYSVAAQMYQACLSIVSSLALSLWPRFVRQRTEDPDQARRTLALSTAVFAMLGAIAGLAVWLLGPVVFSMVTDAQSPSSGLFLAFGALLLATTALQPVSMYLTSRGGLVVQAMATTVAQLANLAISIAVAAHWGATGVVLGSVVAIAAVLPLPLFVAAVRTSRGTIK